MTDDPGETVIILNPQSGGGAHTDAVRHRAELAGYALERTEAAGDAADLAAEAAERGASTVVAAGGDGTVNEVLQGLDRADAFDRLTFGLVPAGTGNNFAGNVGITDIDDAFAALEDGERRRIDLGRADGRVFVNSCVAGLTAESSAETSAELKGRFGVLAYVLTTLRSVPEFEGFDLSVDAHEEGTRTTAWEGEAVCVLVGNGRRFATGGDTQADMEDGLLDVTVVEDVSTVDLMEDAVVERLLGAEAPDVTRLRTPALDITVRDPESVRFSLDGEMVQYDTLALSADPGTVRLPVGETYDPHPDG